MRAIPVLIAGVLMLLSSVAHGTLGWSAMRIELAREGASSALTGALATGWHFGSAAMAAFGILTLICGWRQRRGDDSGRALLLVIGACYVLFGSAAMMLRHPSLHFFLFIALGLLAGVPVLESRDRARGADRAPDR